MNCKYDILSNEPKLAITCNIIRIINFTFMSIFEILNFLFLGVGVGVGAGVIFEFTLSEIIDFFIYKSELIRI